MTTKLTVFLQRLMDWVPDLDEIMDILSEAMGSAMRMPGHPPDRINTTR